MNSPFYAAFDCETTSLNSQLGDILTLYIHLLDENMDDTGSFLNLKLKPDNGHYSVDPSALAVNKIDLIKHNKEAVSYSEGIQEIKEFFAWNIGKEKLTPIGQNFSFDEEYIFEKMPSLDWRKYVSHDGFGWCYYVWHRKT
jgi:hypothetical protein